VSFDGVRMAYLDRSRVGSLVTGAYKFFFSDAVRYPFYGNVGFGEFDVVITEGIHQSLLHYVRRFGPKVILNDSLSRDPGFSNGRVRYLNAHFRNAHAVVVTERVRAVYERYGIAIPVTVIGHPVDTRAIPFRPSGRIPRRLVSVGRLVEEKGWDIIIAAVASLASAYPDLTLDIFGAGPLQRTLARTIAMRGLAQRIRLEGHVRREALLHRLPDYDLFISHPLTTGRAAEAFLMANVEAMAAGLPVITSDCGGVPMVVQDQAVVVRERDVPGLRDAVERLLRGPGDLEARSREGRRFVEQHYGLEVIAERWHRIIERVSGHDRR
jgi:glycosyltransferase involved in cell wall biosynthesis